jgi:iron complex outermembrane receptor protein
VPDLLRREEGLIVKDLYGSGTKSVVDMRGFARGVNTAVLIDGRKVNAIDLSGVDWNLIPLENIERIEVVRGSGSVLYGDNAMAGVINIITKKGKSVKPELSLDAQLKSYKGNKETFTVGGATERINYFLLLGHGETDGYRDRSSFNTNDASSNITVNITKKLYLDLKAGYHKDRQQLPGGLTKSELEDDRRQTTQPEAGVSTRQRYYGFDLVFSPDWGELQAGYTFNNREFTDMMVGEFGGIPYTSNTKRDTDTNELRLKLTVRKDIFDLKNILVTGIDYSRSKVSNNNVFDFFGPSTTLSDIKKRETGLYIEDELFLSKKWVLTAGYRYAFGKFEDKVTSFSTESGSQDFNESALKAGLTFNYFEGSKIFAAYSRSFRLPATDELFAFDGTVVNLEPENADTYEIGIAHSFNKIHQVRLTAFYMDVKNELFLDPAIGFLGENRNIDQTKHQGVEFGLTSKPFDFISLFGNFTYADVRFKSGAYDGNKIPLSPAYSANFGADMKYKEHLALAVNFLWVGERLIENDVENNKKRLPSYLTTDAKLSFNYKMITAYIGVNNIFDKEYSEYAVYGRSSGTTRFYPAPERNYYAGLRLNF